MRLRKFQIRAFRCIYDTGLVDVTDAVALIGKNESGKTAILTALTHLNKDKPVDEQDVCEDLSDNLDENHRIVEGTFELNESEIKTLQEQFQNIQFTKEIIIFRRRNIQFAEYDFPGIKFPTLYALTEKEVPNFNRLIQDIPALIKPLLGSLVFPDVAADAPIENIQGKRAEVEGHIISAMNAVLNCKPYEYKKVKAVFQKFVALVQTHFGANKPVVVGVENLKNSFKNLFISDDTKKALTSFVQDKLHPKILYFSDYKIIEGIVNIPDYISQTAQASTKKFVSSYQFQRNETVRNLLYLAKLEPQKLIDDSTVPARLVPRTTKASSRLSEMLALTWKGKKINVDLSYSHPNLTVSVSDTYENGMSKNKGLLDRRSAGFKWHFSFYVNFRAGIQQAELQDAILLLDEPGLSLHPEQQAGTLDVIKEVSQTNQILYTTHSPFMIHNFERGNILTVEFDNDTKASRIRTNFWEGDWQTITPILHSIGDQILLRVFGAFGNTKRIPLLIVEGNSDYKYLFTIGQHMPNPDALGNIFPFPAGGAPQVKELTLYHHERDRRVIALFDNEPSGQEEAGKLEKQGFPKERIVVIPTDKDECDIEDLFTDDDYLRAVNDFYSEKLRNSKVFRTITKDDLKKSRNQAGSKRVVKALETFFKQNEGWGSFDKEGVCRNFCKQSLSLKPTLSRETIARFTKLFEALHNASNHGEEKVDAATK